MTKLEVVGMGLGVGRYYEVIGSEDFPAKFYDSLEDEAPLYAASPFDAPNWGEAIVAVVPAEDWDGDHTAVFLLGEDYWDALKKLADEIWEDYLNGDIDQPKLLRGRLWLDYDEDGELYQFAVREGGYSFIATRDGERSMIETEHGKVFEGHAPAEPAPEEVKKEMLYDLLCVYFPC